MRNIFSIVAVALLVVWPAMATEVDYFPRGIFGEDPKSSEFCERWYSAQLKGLKEPSLWELSRTQKLETYRFLWLRTFHPPISVRLSVNADGTSTVTIKRGTIGRDAFSAGKLMINRTRALSKDRTQYFLDGLAELGFWAMPTFEKTDTIGADGAEWILEGVKDGRYLVVDRWSPKAGEAVHSLGIYMLIDIAKFKLLYQDVY